MQRTLLRVIKKHLCIVWINCKVEKFVDIWVYSNSINPCASVRQSASWIYNELSGQRVYQISLQSVWIQLENAPITVFLYMCAGASIHSKLWHLLNHKLLQFNNVSRQSSVMTEARASSLFNDNSSNNNGLVRVFAKLKNSKNPNRKWDIAQPTHPHLNPNFFWKPITDMDRTLKS